MTDDPLLHTGGWEVKSKSENDGTFFVNVRLVSVDPCEYDDETHDNLHRSMATHTHRKSIRHEWYEFDHDPSTEELQAAIDADGFDPKKPDFTGLVTYPHTGNAVVKDQVTMQNPDPIKSITEGEDDVYEYSAVLHPTEFNELFSMLPITVDDKPTSMCKKGDWLYLFYVRDGSERPAQFFDEDFFLYSVRVHKDTGETRRKGYNRGLTLTEEELNQLEGADELENIIATGYFLDEPYTTLYYMCSSEPEDYVADAAVVEVPYLGTTWENGVKFRTRKYTRESLGG